MARHRRPYSTIGPYRHGVWLVSKGGSGIVTDRKHLPKQGTGWEYYWLGSTASQAEGRVVDALGKLKVDMAAESIDFGTPIENAFHGKPTSIGAKPGNFLQQLLRAGAAGGIPAPSAIGGGLGGDVGTGTGAAESGGLSGTAKAGIFGASAAALTDPLDFLKFIAWIFHPRNILRIVEFLTGIALVMFGIHALMQGRGERLEGFTTSEGALTRSGLGRVARELGAAARSDASGRRRRPVRPAPAPHTTRREALRVRYARERQVSQRRTQARRAS